jgi:hypothetical protein
LSQKASLLLLEIINCCAVLQFDDLSHKSSGSSINTNQTSTATPVAGSLENLAGGEVLRRTFTAPVLSPVPVKSTGNRTVDEWEQKLYGKQGKGKIAYVTGCCKILETAV